MTRADGLWYHKYLLLIKIAIRLGSYRLACDTLGLEDGVSHVPLISPNYNRTTVLLRGG